MSSFICSDYTILAIVDGMRRHGFIESKKRDMMDMATSLRLINEYQTTKRYVKSGTTKRWMVECDHREVTATPRRFGDGEVLAAIACYLYQIDTEPLRDLDFTTIIAVVKMLRDRIIAEGEQAGTIKTDPVHGNRVAYEKQPDGSFRDVLRIYGWDLAA